MVGTRVDQTNAFEQVRSAPSLWILVAARELSIKA